MAQPNDSDQEGTDPYQYFGLSCPRGGSFYICTNASTQFLGCCSIDACENAGVCPQDSLRSSSFSADSYPELPRQDCVEPQGTGTWYTCEFNTPPFMGCCAENPCSRGSCPAAHLVPAKLSDVEQLRSKLLEPSDVLPAGHNSSVTTPLPETEKSTVVLAKVLGPSVGATVFVVIVAVLALVRMRRRKRRRLQQRESQAHLSGGISTRSSTLPPSALSPPLPCWHHHARTELPNEEAQIYQMPDQQQQQQQQQQPFELAGHEVRDGNWGKEVAGRSDRSFTEDGNNSPLSVFTPSSLDRGIPGEMLEAQSDHRAIRLFIPSKP